MPSNQKFEFMDWSNRFLKFMKICPVHMTVIMAVLVDSYGIHGVMKIIVTELMAASIL